MARLDRSRLLYGAAFVFIAQDLFAFLRKAGGVSAVLVYN